MKGSRRESIARAAAVVFLVSLALLDAQVTATRLIAYRFFYHFVFFVVSLAQLGLRSGRVGLRLAPLRLADQGWCRGWSRSRVCRSSCSAATRGSDPRRTCRLARSTGSRVRVSDLIALGLVALNSAAGWR